VLHVRAGNRGVNMKLINPEIVTIMTSKNRKLTLACTNMSAVLCLSLARDCAIIYVNISRQLRAVHVCLLARVC
jgi:hypothetical protein